MVDFDKLAAKAKEVVGDLDTDDLKDAAGELKDIATGEGSVADKAKEAVDVVKDTIDSDEEAETADTNNPADTDTAE